MTAEPHSAKPRISGDLCFINLRESMVYFAYACLGISIMIAIGNIAGCVGAERRYRRGIEEGYSSVPILSLLFSFLAWAFGGSSIGIWAFIPAALDPGTWMLVGLPLALLDIDWPQRKRAERHAELDKQRTRHLSDCIARLASEATQIRYCVNGTDDNYILVDDLVNDFDSALAYFRFESNPSRWTELERQLGNAAFARVVELESLLISNRHCIDDYDFSTLDKLILEDPRWIQVRTKANQTLECMRFDLQRWEQHCGL